MEDSTHAVKQWLMTDGVDWAINIVMALAIFIIGRMIARILTGMLRKGFVKSGMDETLAGFLCEIAKILMTLVVVMEELENTLHLNITVYFMG